MTTDAPTYDWAALGAALRAHRERKRMTRADVEEAGGPAQATVQRIEEGNLKRGIKAATKEDLERALDLPDGWIDKFLATPHEASNEEPDPIIIEGNGERLLVAITEGVSQLPIKERRAVYALVRQLREGTEGYGG